MKRAGMIVSVFVWAGCGALTSFYSSKQTNPGKVSRTSDGWKLAGVMVHVKEDRILRVDALEEAGKPEGVKVILTLNTWDRDLDCGSAGLKSEGRDGALEQLQFTHVTGASMQGVQGFLPRAALAEFARAEAVKIYWCGVEVPLDANQAATVKDFSRRVAL